MHSEPDHYSKGGICPEYEEACRIGVHGVPTVTTHERVLYYGAASPGKVRTLLTSRDTIS